MEKADTKHCDLKDQQKTLIQNKAKQKLKQSSHRAKFVT